MTYFDAHKLEVGSRVFFPAEPLPVSGANPQRPHLHYHAGKFFRVHTVSATWTNAARTLTRVRINRAGTNWLDPVAHLEVIR